MKIECIKVMGAKWSKTA